MIERIASVGAKAPPLVGDGPQRLRTEDHAAYAAKVEQAAALAGKAFSAAA